MNNIADLQPAYNETYQHTSDITIQFITEFLNTYDGKTIAVKAAELRKEISKQVLSMLTKWNDELKFDRTDLFTADLINSYHENIEKYENKNISFFIRHHLPGLKAYHIDTIHEFPLNYSLTPEETVKLIAKHNAIQNLERKLIFISVDENETVTSLIEKIKTCRIEDLINASKKMWLNEAIAREGKEGQQIGSTGQPEIIQSPFQINGQEIVKEGADIAMNENPFPKIFVSFTGFQIFQTYKDEVVRLKSEYADYSYIFTMLKKDGLIHDMKHDTFIEFLWKEYKVSIVTKYNQFKSGETTEKRRSYSRIKKQFL